MASPQDRADFSTWFVADWSYAESDCLLAGVCCAHTHTVWRDILLILRSFSSLVNGHQYMKHSSLSSRQRQLLDSFLAFFEISDTPYEMWSCLLEWHQEVVRDAGTEALCT